MRFVFLPTAFIVYWILVHYRVGSLESDEDLFVDEIEVHYRVGSLENIVVIGFPNIAVHYRVGSLEKCCNSLRK